MNAHNDWSHPLPCRRSRASTYARDGSNDDFINLKPGKTWAARFDERGEVRHIFIAAEPCGHDVDLSQIRLVGWFDGGDFPQIDAPIGDLVGLGHGRMVDVQSNFFDACPRVIDGKQGASLNIWMPMPFAAGAYFEFRNCGEHAVRLFVYLDTLQFEGSLGPGPYRFHATYREAFTHPVAADYDGEEMLNTDGADNYVILDVEDGEGTYLGCILNVDSNPRTPGVWDEGDDMIFVDSLDWPPRMHGTGTDNYFNLAMGIRRACSLPYHGVPLAERDNSPQSRDCDGRFTAYRLHIVDPVPFRTLIKATIEHGHNNSCGAHYRSVALWYGAGRDVKARKVEPRTDAIFGNIERI